LTNVPLRSAIMVGMGRLLVLWDVDGTLVRCGPVGRAAIEAGAAYVAGLPSVPQVVMSGKTDPQIVAEILAAAGVPDADIAPLIPGALREAESCLAASEATLMAEGRDHPGVAALMDALAESGHVRQTLVTGNVAANAALKVRAFGLDRHLDLEVGAYGSDDAERAHLVPICLKRVRDLRDEIYEVGRVWVVGDTPHDLRCARAAGVRCLLVGTGRAGFTSIRGLGADAVFEDLSDTESVLTSLLEGSGDEGRVGSGPTVATSTLMDAGLGLDAQVPVTSYDP
jgi:phosphoglycolate phosphatase